MTWQRKQEPEDTGTWHLVTEDGTRIGLCIYERWPDQEGYRFIPHIDTHRPGTTLRVLHSCPVMAIPTWAFDLSDDMLTTAEWEKRKESMMRFISVTGRNLLKLANDLDGVAAGIAECGADTEGCIKRAVEYLVSRIEQTAADFREGVGARPESFMDRPTAIFGDELALLESLAEDRWINFNDYETEIKGRE